MSRAIQTGPKVDTAQFEQVNNDRGKLIFTRCNLPFGKLTLAANVVVLYNNNRLLAAKVLPENFTQAMSQVGNIYIGRIQSINKSLNACFVEIGKQPGMGKNSQVCFLPFSEADRAVVLNRPNQSIIPEQLKCGDQLLIQITRDAQKTKLCSCSTRLSLSNDYFVLTAGAPRVLFSGKLCEEQKTTLQKELGAALDSYTVDAKQTKGSSSLIPPMQLMVRTKAAELNGEALCRELDTLQSAFYLLYENAPSRVCFSCLKQGEDTGIETLLNQMVHPWEYEEILTDCPETYEYLRKSALDKSLRLYEDSLLSLNRLYGLDSKIEEALKSRIWLKSGANLIIEPTEALTVIDVNSGKIEASKGKTDLALQINLEAAQEVAKQLRLRNLSGIIIVDFINLKEKEQEQLLLKTLREAVATDITKTHVIDMTPLGLVEITRKKVHKPLAEQVREIR